MIPRTPPPCQTKTSQAKSSQAETGKTNLSIGHWQTALASAIRDPAELLKLLDLPESLLKGAIAASETFALRVPRGYLQRIQKAEPNDPLLRQILPLDAELISDDHFMLDPVADLAAMAVPGLLHKYQGRVLLIMTAACAVHCRYCFRRHFPYQENHSDQNWLAAIEYIRDNSNIHEVILSGGDPLSLSESRLKRLTDKLIDIPHIKTLRLHTRQPIVLPERVNDDLLNWLNSLPWKIVLVLHCNHANEIDQSVARALSRLQQQQITLLNQSVLLAGVNDSSDALAALSHRLFANHVHPYYLHLLDKVQGAKHFHVEKEKASQILAELRSQLPGYLVPKLVKEIPGESSKIPVL